MVSVSLNFKDFNTKKHLVRKKLRNFAGVYRKFTSLNIKILCVV
jgi:hypothetical protein